MLLLLHLLVLPPRLLIPVMLVASLHLLLRRPCERAELGLGPSKQGSQAIATDRPNRLQDAARPPFGFDTDDVGT